jgi:hypothetical protein
VNPIDAGCVLRASNSAAQTCSSVETGFLIGGRPGPTFTGKFGQIGEIWDITRSVSEVAVQQRGLHLPAVWPPWKSFLAAVSTGLGTSLEGFSGSRIGRWRHGEDLEKDAPRYEPVVVDQNRIKRFNGVRKQFADRVLNGHASWLSP